MLNKLFEKYLHSSVDMVVNGIVDGKQGQKLKTVIPQTDLNMVGHILLHCFYCCFSFYGQKKIDSSLFTNWINSV